MSNKLKKGAILLTILASTLLAKANAQNLLGVGYLNRTTGKSSIYANASFNKNLNLDARLGSGDLAVSGDMKFSIKDTEIKPLFALTQSLTEKDDNNRETSIEPAFGIGAERYFGENLKISYQLVGANSSSESNSSERLTTIDNLVDDTVPYTYTITTEVDAKTATKTGSNVLSHYIGVEPMKNLKLFYITNSGKVDVNSNTKVDTKVTVDGTAAGTNVHNVTYGNSDDTVTASQDISQNSIGGSYIISGPMLASLSAWTASNMLANVNGSASNNGINVGARVLINIGNAYLDDFVDSEKEIGDINLKSGVLGTDTVNARVKLRERKYRDTLRISVDTDGNIGARASKGDLNGKLELNNTNTTLGVGYKDFDFEYNTTKGGSSSYNIGYTTEF